MSIRNWENDVLVEIAGPQHRHGDRQELLGRFIESGEWQTASVLLANALRTSSNHRDRAECSIPAPPAWLPPML
jgi:hypothetical protein